MVADAFLVDALINQEMDFEIQKSGEWRSDHSKLPRSQIRNLSTWQWKKTKNVFS